MYRCIWPNWQYFQGGDGQAHFPLAGRGNPRYARLDGPVPLPAGLLPSLLAALITLPAQISSQCQIFGLPLRLDGIVPAIVSRCVAFVEAHGLSFEGIYRISGSVAVGRDLHTRFNQNDEVGAVANATFVP